MNTSNIKLENYVKSKPLFFFSSGISQEIELPTYYPHLFALSALKLS